ncbi:thiamine pyrophosphate-requiring protein [Labrys monachus]|uniref:Acetolactate synthase-1/2/3 large subunit n=1 Tax=Labrys monachus TaxID=217067 RepID=A0ABU0FFX8_9HYPH|nr:thiamine pyrophosphate-requiring protein [Labrys monachus]MDQ0392955.1 acetolactate synthase-1/2/3 large subunit [Labrys monachus]
MNGAEVVAAILKREGVERIIGFPHSELIETTAALGMPPLITRTERIAVNIADGFTRVSGARRLAAVTVQYGPGAECAFGAVAQAYSDNTPLLFLPTGHPLGRNAVPQNFEALRSFAHVTGWSVRSERGDALPQLFQNAFARARNGTPGPLMIELPTDILQAPAPWNPDAYVPPRRSSPCADPVDIRRMLDALLAAECPLLLAGQGVLYADGCEELLALAELLQIPVVTTLNGKSAFPEDHPLSLGTGGKSYASAIGAFYGKADFILGVGTSFTRSLYITPLPAACRLAQVTLAPADIGKDYPVDMAVVADAKAVLGQLLEEARSRRGLAEERAQSPVAAEIAALHHAFAAKWAPLVDDDASPMSPYRVLRDLSRTVDLRKTIATHDAGHPRDQMLPFWKTPIPHGYVGWGKSTQLGSGLGLMIGARLARPDHLCIAVMGEAAFGMVGMDFETATRHQLPIMVVLFRNGIMGGYGQYLPQASERFGVDRLTGDYVGVARALGGHAERVEAPRDLVPAFRRAIAAIEEGRPALVECVTREERRIPGLV